MPLTSETGPAAGAPRADGARGSAAADPAAREFLRRADPVLRELIDARPDFHPRAWLDELPPLDGFGTLVFQVVGQQLSVTATRTIVSRLQEQFGERMPSPRELLAVQAISHCVEPYGTPTASTTCQTRTRWPG
jgi:3-methyladenine DNA glycosylase/8-oxoguanine DNA glycosylase